MTFSFMVVINEIVSLEHLLIKRNSKHDYIKVYSEVNFTLDQTWHLD